MHLPDLELLRAFTVFAEHMNFTRAARALHLSQPALHGRVAQLGETLGVTLYERRGRALELTAAGRKVLAFAREIDGRARAFVGELHGHGDAESIALCAGEGTFLYLLDEALRAWMRAPAAPLRLLTRDHIGTVAAVRNGDAHLGVTLIDAPPDGLLCETLAVVPQVLAVRGDHPLATRSTVTLASLDGARLVVPSPERPHRQRIDEALARRGVQWTVAVEAHGWELTLRFVELGVGAAIVNAFCPLPAGVVARALPELPTHTYGIVRRRGVKGPLAHDTLRAVLRDQCRRWRDA